MGKDDDDEKDGGGGVGVEARWTKLGSRWMGWRRHF